MTKIQTHANFTIETNKTVNHDYWYQSTFYAPKGSTQSTDKIGHLIDISTARIDTSNTQMVKIIPHTMFEVIDSKISTVIKPYFDFDLKLPKGTKMTKTKIENAYKACKKGILELIPDVNWKDVAIAERHGYSSIHECKNIMALFVNNIWKRYNPCVKYYQRIHYKTVKPFLTPIVIIHIKKWVWLMDARDMLKTRTGFSQTMTGY